MLWEGASRGVAHDIWADSHATRTAPQVAGAWLLCWAAHGRQAGHGTHRNVAVAALTVLLLTVVLLAHLTAAAAAAVAGVDADALTAAALLPGAVTCSVVLTQRAHRC
jgi:uncharacterized transporter YbjL